jgi:plasmid stabilization system protein ParE
MAGDVIWALEALDDIDAIASYIARDSTIHASRVASEIFDLGELLLTQPMMGRIVPELSDDLIREHFIYSYRVIYQISGEDIHVLAVIHGKRLLESIADRL